MRRKICIIIGVVIIPILILIVDHLLFYQELKPNYDQSSEWAYIVEHKMDYPPSLLKLAMKNKETIPFVSHYRDYKEKHYSLNDDLKKGTIPHLLQWDERWGYKVYGNEMMAINGCGPTCLSMIVSYLTQNPRFDPYYIATFSYRRGYYSREGTTKWTLMSEGAKYLGVNVEEIPLDEQRIINELKQGHPLICSVSAGDFTSSGHYIVMKDYQDGLFYVNDPNSIEKSKRGYTYHELSYQIKNIWSYCKKS